MFKVLHLEKCPVTPMAGGRGEQIKLINPGLGTEKLDVHFVDGETYVIRENDVVYIPAGMTHSLSNLSDKPFEIFEIYAPAGRHFDVVVDE